MADVRIASSVVPDDGKSDGIFWRDGQRWLRESGRESMIAHLSPDAEAAFQRRMDSEMGRLGMAHEHAARRASTQDPLTRSEAVMLELAGVMARWQMTLDEVLDVLSAHVGRRADELRMDLSATAIVRDLDEACSRLHTAGQFYHSAAGMERLRT